MIESFKIPSATFPTHTGSIVTFNSQYAGLPLKSHKVNIDSVSGVSELVITACGVNFAQIANQATSTVQGVESTITDSKLVATGRSTGNGDITVTFSEPLVIKSGMSISLSLVGTDTRKGTLTCIFHKRGGGYGTNQAMANNVHTITLKQEGVFDYILLRTTNGNTVDIDAYIMIGTSTEYVPFNGLTSVISIGSTVNEGEYDARTGILEVTLPSVQTIQLPPCPIDTKGVGVQNIWADTGDTTLQYPKFG